MTSYPIMWWLRTVTISVGRGWWVYPSDTLLWPPILTFYHFPYTTDPPTSTMPTQPSATITWSPLTIPSTHCTISPVPHWRPPIWPMDHIVIFSFLSLFSFTQCVLSRPSQSQVITLHGQDLTICFTTHELCACFTYHLYLRLLYLLQKKKEVFPQNSDLSLFHPIVSSLSVSHLHPILHYHTILNLHLTLLCTPQHCIRRPSHCSQTTPLRTT